jgi:hypothetical protein
MSHDFENRIRARAYEIWENEGCPHGRDREFWLQAERELLEQPIAAAKALAQEVAAAMPKRARRKSSAA